ncbi:hypothetical protein ACJRO7_022006 [Eucalyptus globulus]|uniref:Uncharacterized protein n=1 Tax=Eucalyptus globulus TaxID=34317 RepID=A0ABD3KU63_EUCGL
MFARPSALKHYDLSLFNLLTEQHPQSHRFSTPCDKKISARVVRSRNQSTPSWLFDSNSSGPLHGLSSPAAAIFVFGHSRQQTEAAALPLLRPFEEAFSPIEVQEPSNSAHSRAAQTSVIFSSSFRPPNPQEACPSPAVFKPSKDNRSLAQVNISPQDQVA